MSTQVPSGVGNRLALGTAQFGLTYGVANHSGQVLPDAVRAILKRAALAGVDTLDTAIAYGASESVLGESDLASWRVISKLPPLPATVRRVGDWMDEQVRASLARLHVARLDALLLHRPADLLGPCSADYSRALDSLKSRGYVRAVGISIYDPSELEQLWPSWRPDIVQAPCSVLDRRLIHSGWLARLHDAGVRVHVRSLFLQGLLLMRTERPAWFDRWRTLLDRWLGWCEEQRVTPLRAAIAFVSTYSEIERYVVGVDSLAQLEEVLSANGTSVPVLPDTLFSDDPDLLEPSRWKLS